MSEAYLLFGPEEGKKQDWINEKKREILKSYPDAEQILLFTFETTPEVLTDALNSSSLFSSSKIVQLKSFDDVKKGALVNALIKYLKNPSDNSFLFIISSENSVRKFPAELTALIKKENSYQIKKIQ